MRYRFRGLMRDTGKAVEGHVEAPTSDSAYRVLGDNGVVTEALVLDPAPRRPMGAGLSTLEPSEPPESAARPERPEAPPQSPVGAPSGGEHPASHDSQHSMTDHAWTIADALESAFDTAVQQVSVDKLAERFRGQRVRVIDRDKIRKRVLQMIEQAMAQSSAREETHEETRDRISSAIEEMFKDNRNLTSQVQQGNAALERQIQRLSRVVEGLERAVANMSTVLRTGGGGGGGGSARFSHDQRTKSQAQDAVLLEIFETNLDLRRQLEDGETAAQGAAAPESAVASTDTDQASSTPAADETGVEQGQTSPAS